MTAMRAGTSEYDRFGPWIMEVEGPDDVPRLYRSHPIDFESAQLVLKMPRNIARRDAHAAMDLYDHLLILTEGHLTVLSRRIEEPGAPGLPPVAAGEGFDVIEIPLADVVAIRDAGNLLDCVLTLFTAGGEHVAVHYNGSARDTVTALIDRLKRAAVGADPSPVGAALLDAGSRHGELSKAADPTRADTRTVTGFLEVRAASPGLVVWASHPLRRVAPIGTGLRGAVLRVLHVLSPMTLHGALFAADDTALEVFGRHAWLVRGKAPIYTYSRLVIPWRAPDRLDLAPHPAYDDATVVTVGAGEWSAQIVVPDGSDASVLLRAAADTPSRGPGS